MSAKTLPKYNDFHWPTVMALRALGGSGSNSEIDEKVVEQQGFSEEQQSLLHNEGPMTEIGYRLHWARSYLKGMGLADNPRRGVWALTPAGREVSENEIPELRADYLRKMRDRGSPPLRKQKMSLTRRKLRPRFHGRTDSWRRFSRGTRRHSSGCASDCCERRGSAGRR